MKTTAESTIPAKSDLAFMTAFALPYPANVREPFLRTLDTDHWILDTGHWLLITDP